MTNGLSGVWPVFGVRLTTPRLTLRVATEADLPALAAIVPDDADPDPSLPRHDFLDGRAARVAALCQSYWRAFAEWRADDWRLAFIVARDGTPVGMQELEGRRFASRRTVETASWLEPSSRGIGLGKEMRAAVLHLAFDGLGAEYAMTDAVEGNAASLGVSRALGYQPNGFDVQVHARGTATMVKLRLARQTWQQATPFAPVTVHGLAAVLPYFGI